MASACINNVSLSPEKFLDCPAGFPSYGWLSPQMSFGRDEEVSKCSVKPRAVDENQDDDNSCDDFEFRLNFPVKMLPADELISDGKLMPLEFRAASEVRVSDTAKVERSSEIDPYLFSPKAPRCSSGWKELLGLKRLYQKKQTNSGSGGAKSLKQFVDKNSKPDSSLSLPLLRDSSDMESISIALASSRLSCSSCGHDLALDLEKPHHSNLAQKHPRIRMVKHRTVQVDSPRMNSSGKIVFERSSSSPSSFKQRGVERSYSGSANVPVSKSAAAAAVFGFPLFSPR